MQACFVRLLPSLLLLVAAPAYLYAQDPQPQLEEQDELCLDNTFETAPFTPPTGSQQVEGVGSIEKVDRGLESLLQKINAATGSAKMDAIGELLAALVEDRRSVHKKLETYAAMMLTIMQRTDDCEAGHFCEPR
jgi:hypothetical protein